jgi:predicted acyltransferase
MFKNTANQFAAGRVLSLDVMRGLIMLLLCAESCLLYVALKGLHLAQPAAMLIEQFFHHPWHGLRFWDLIQPAFMFMAGAAMYISYSHKLEKGSSWERNWRHILFRSFKLFLFGVALHCVYAGKPVWELWNVLTQLAFTTLVAYLMIGKSYIWQMVCSLGLLLLTELMYRLILVPGFDQPFVEGHNFGSYADVVLMGKINSDGWVAINAIPTAAHTIWGVLAGKLLISAHSASYKIKMLMGFGLLALLLGFGLDAAEITPIIKRISTSSFVFASGGSVLIMLAIAYWLVDVKRYVKYIWIFSVMGMNAIFIYIFFETLGMQWLNGTIGIFTSGILTTLFGIPLNISAVVSALSTLLLEWSLCYWLYKRNIFFKL